MELNGYFIILAVCALLCILEIVFIKKRLVSPIFIVPASFFLASVFAIIGRGTWNDITLRPTAVGIISFGLVFFCCGALLYTGLNRLLSHFTCRHIILFQSNRIDNFIRSHQSFIFKALPWILILFCLTNLLLRYLETKTIINQSGHYFSSFFENVAYVRSVIAGPWNYSDSYSSVGFSPLSKLLEKMCTAIYYFSIVLLTLKLCLHLSDISEGTCRSYIETYDLSVPTGPWVAVACLCMAQVILSGTRYLLFCSIIIFVFVVYSLWVSRIFCPNKVGRRKLLYASCFFILASFIVIFVSTLNRRSTGFHGIDYVTSYLSAGIPGLQKALEQGFRPSFSGACTFNSLFAVLNKLGCWQSPGAYAPNFVTFGSLGINVFTCFYRYYVDFGMMGVVVLSSLAGFIYQAVFLKSFEKPFSTVFYLAIVMVPSVVDLFREEYLFSQYLSINIFLIFVTMIFLAYLYKPLFEKIGRARS